MRDQLIAAWAGTSNIEVLAVVFGLIYIVLATKENVWCWPAGFIGTGSSIFLLWSGDLYMEAALNAYYLLMAVFGWWQWQYGSKNRSRLEIRSFSKNEHLTVFGLIVFLTLISGYLLSRYTDAAFPYLDSFTTWSAIITTWMVTQKILDNWLYWIVINSLSIYIYIDRGFLLYAILFGLYVIIAIFGYSQWRKKLINFTHNQPT